MKASIRSTKGLVAKPFTVTNTCRTESSIVIGELRGNEAGEAIRLTVDNRCSPQKQEKGDMIAHAALNRTISGRSAEYR
ncbi:hypothetical protein GCM10022419_003430 [Nonomuraea rosea]|uniref:Uncharacterized protein n=1 Tax=Nonomuraea rosea TaxID=638574 RepID=A0ABP6V328_9ACTN